jgi:hypothetical protein
VLILAVHGAGAAACFALRLPRRSFAREREARRKAILPMIFPRGIFRKITACVLARLKHPHGWRWRRRGAMSPRPMKILVAGIEFMNEGEQQGWLARWRTGPELARFTEPSRLAGFRRKASELDEPSLLGMERQRELLQPRAHGGRLGLCGVYLTRFHASSAVPPTDAAGLVYFSSSAVSDTMSRF